MTSKFHMKFWLVFIVVFTILLLPRFIFAKTFIKDDISVDTTWTKANSPYILERSIVVFEEATLNIEPGVEIKFPYFSPGNSIYFFGKLIAIGSEEEPIYFTSNSDDALSNTDDEEYCDEEYDEEGNLISKTNCEYFDFNEPFVGDWGGLYFIDSENNILENININYANVGLTFQNSEASLKHFLIINSQEGILAFNNSSIDILDAQLLDLEQNALILYNNTLINFSNLIIENVINNPINVYNESSLSGNYLEFNGSSLSGYTEAIILFNGSNLVLNSAKFNDCPLNSCITFFDSEYFLGETSLLEINDTLFAEGRGSGLLTFSGKPTNLKITNSAFLDFDLFAIESYRDISTIDARNNYFGDMSGPYHSTQNSEGKGEAIYGNNILFYPWLFNNPFELCIEDCASNVLFIPGMQGSRLYADLGSGEKELWLSRKDSYHEALFLDEEGKSINEVYTKNDIRNNGDKKETGIIDEAILGINIYKSLGIQLKNLKTDKIINDYSFIPYDWRLALDDILNNGKVFGNKNQNLSYLENSTLEESFIYKELSKLAKSSKSGKVSIVSHSNGGLVTKALIQKLKDNNDPLYEKIDEIFFVAVPQIGAPEAVLALLFGTGVGPFDSIMDQDVSRGLGENMPTLYNLLPRESYFNLINNKDSKKAIINFSTKTKFENEKLKNTIEKYGNNIDSFSELEDYLKGGDYREKPAINDTKNANIANIYLYNNAINLYEMLDNWQANPTTKVYQVGGLGMETILGLDYKEVKKLLGKKEISPKARKTIYGDGTVPLVSATFMNESQNIEQWYVDLDKANKDNVIPKDHAFILEIPNLLDFIKNKLKGEKTFLDPENIIFRNRTTLASHPKKLIYTLHSPLYLGVFDKDGNFSGKDEQGNIINEILGAEYSIIGEVQSLSIPIELAHTLVLNGFDDGYFSLELDEFSNDNYSGNQIFDGIKNTKNTKAKLVFENENSLDNLKLLVDLEGDGEFELEYLPYKEEVIIPIPEIINNPGVVLINANNNTRNIVPAVLGESIEINEQNKKVITNNEENLHIEKDNTLIINNQNLNSTQYKNLDVEGDFNKKNEAKTLDKDIKEEIIIDDKIPQDQKRQEGNYRYLIIFLVLITLLISFKYLFKIK